VQTHGRKRLHGEIFEGITGEEEGSMRTAVATEFDEVSDVNAAIMHR
jgi:hypothetical protein